MQELQNVEQDEQITETENLDNFGDNISGWGLNRNSNQELFLQCVQCKPVLILYIKASITQNQLNK